MEKAEEMLHNLFVRYTFIMDANDIIYTFESTRYYDPAPHLLEIKVPLIAINSADDQVNTLELGLMEKEIKWLIHTSSHTI